MTRVDRVSSVDGQGGNTEWLDELPFPFTYSIYYIEREEGKL
jgi:hypothetical protein